MASGGHTRTTTLFDFGVAMLQKAASSTNGESDRADVVVPIGPLLMNTIII